MRNPTFVQTEVLQYIDEYGREHGKTPTYREMQEWFGWSNASAGYHHVSALIRKGMVEHEVYEDRGLKITERGKEWISHGFGKDSAPGR